MRIAAVVIGVAFLVFVLVAAAVWPSSLTAIALWVGVFGSVGSIVGLVLTYFEARRAAADATRAASVAEETQRFVTRYARALLADRIKRAIALCADAIERLSTGSVRPEVITDRLLRLKEDLAGLGASGLLPDETSATLKSAVRDVASIERHATSALRDDRTKARDALHLIHSTLAEADGAWARQLREHGDG